MCEYNRVFGGIKLINKLNVVHLFFRFFLAAVFLMCMCAVMLVFVSGNIVSKFVILLLDSCFRRQRFRFKKKGDKQHKKQT